MSQEQVNTQQESTINTLSLPDEEVEKINDPESFFGSSSDTLDTESEAENESEDQSQDSDVGTQDDDDNVKDSSDEDTHYEEGDETSEDSAEKDSEAEKTKEEGEDSDESTDEDSEETDESDSKLPEDVERIFKPFKANGKEFKVDSVDEVVQLMQMGLNYNKKMASLKPSLKVLKTLQNNDLLDEDKLNFLIDVDKKNPKAIKKLLRESKIDPMDLDRDNEGEEDDYTPNTYNASDIEVELDSVLEEIQDTPSGKTTIDIIGNKWDEKSRDYLANNPKIISLINQHVDSGIYSDIEAAMDKAKTLGQLDGYTDLEAYKIIGDQLYAQKEQKAKAASKPIVKRPSSKKSDPKIASKKKAASPPKSGKPKKEQAVNPLSLSDEEFEKLVSDKFL